MSRIERLSPEESAIGIEGNLQGLKPSQINRLEKLFQRRIHPREIVTQEFARHLTEISREINRQVGVLVNRGGYVEYVVVGNARAIVLPDLKRTRMSVERFRGLRCLHTHLSGEELSQDDLTDLALLRLDLMAAIEVRPDGLPGLVRAAYVLPSGVNGQDGHGARDPGPGRNSTPGRNSMPAGNSMPDSGEDNGHAGVPDNSLWALIEPRVPSLLGL